MSALNVVSFPDRNISDIPRMLRAIANSIEGDEYGEVHNVVWVMDRGNGRIEVGLLGQSGEAAPAAHFLLALGMKKLESVLTDA